jgi:CheY-like chemotaxis protein
VSAFVDVSSPPRLRVVIVDDNDDIRVLLRVQLARDERFEVVGEGVDGEQAIGLAHVLQPDLLILDRQMPRLGGVEAIPHIKQRAPATAIVLYTAQADARTHQAALAAGAVDVLDKTTGGLGFVERLVDTLLDRAAAVEGSVEVRLGPVAGEAARVWVANTKTIIDAVAAHPDVLDEPIPDDVLELFRSFLDQWADIAGDADEFRWVARASPADVERVVSSWAAIDRMTDDDVARLGVHWSPPQGEPFFHALTEATLDALQRHDDTARLAARLSEQWGR